MGLLHELVAVEPDLKAKAAAAMAELAHTFGSPDLFLGQRRTYKALVDGDETFPPEAKRLRSTVEKELSEFAKKYTDYMNTTISKELNNANARADVVVDGEVLLESMTAPSLLNLEARLAEIRQLILAIPTLDRTEEWNFDEKDRIWVTPLRVTYKTRKVPRNHVLAEATKEHPAQVQMYQEDVRVGEWDTVLESGAMTTQQKAIQIERIDTLLVAVKKARQRANSVDAQITDVAGKIFGYLSAP